MKGRIAAAPLAVLDRLEQAGFQAYLVGGCVRDLLLNVPPEDYDIATDATPEQVQKLFPGSVPTGLRHGTVSVLKDGHRIEVTTFRTEGEYLDARRPGSVTFVKSLETDLARRDFTINAMAMDRRGVLIDPFGGREDLRNKTIRSVGSADRRFAEDALRMMRAVRFAARFNATIEARTWQTIVRNAERLSLISRERIRDEWNKIVCSGLSAGMKHLTDAALFRFVFPGLAGCGRDLLCRAAEFAERLPRKADLRHAAFFWKLAVGKRDAGEHLRRLRQPNALIRSVMSVLAAVPDSDPLGWPAETWRVYLYRHGKEAAASAMLILRRMRPEADGQIADRFEQAARRQPLWSVRELAITGQDLMDELGIPPGPVIGQIRERLIRSVLGNPSVNSRERLLSAAAGLYRELAERSKG